MCRIKKILCTGAAGFIGSHFLNYMISFYPHNIFVAIDKVTYSGNINNISKIMKYIHFYKADICDSKVISEIFNTEKPDLVINFAAESSVDKSIIDDSAFIMTNQKGTENLLSMCVKYGNIRFHQISTDEVYGEILDEENSADESFELNPTNPYSITKAEADNIVVKYNKKYGLPTTISRSCNNYGPNQHIEKFIPKIINCIEKHKKIPIYGDGLQIRSWLHVFDHCTAIDKIINYGKSGEIYNIGSVTSLRNIDLTKKILNKFGHDENDIEFIKDRKFHDFRYCINDDKIRNDLSWSQKYTLDYYLDSL